MERPSTMSDEDQVELRMRLRERRVSTILEEDEIVPDSLINAELRAFNVQCQRNKDLYGESSSRDWLNMYTIFLMYKASSKSSMIRVAVQNALEDMECGSLDADDANESLILLMIRTNYQIVYLQEDALTRDEIDLDGIHVDNLLEDKADEEDKDDDQMFESFLASWVLSQERSPSTQPRNPEQLSDTEPSTTDATGDPKM